MELESSVSVELAAYTDGAGKRRCAAPSPMSRRPRSSPDGSIAGAPSVVPFGPGGIPRSWAASCPGMEVGHPTRAGRLGSGRADRQV